MEKELQTGIISDETIMNKIYTIRDPKVVFDKRLAELYGVQPGRLREQVKRNTDRFPERYMSQLTDSDTIEENKDLLNHL